MDFLWSSCVIMVPRKRHPEWIVFTILYFYLLLVTWTELSTPDEKVSKAQTLIFYAYLQSWSTGFCPIV